MTATNDQTKALGYTLPVGTDKINTGDNDITQNAKTSAGLILALQSGLADIKARREYIIQQTYLSDVTAAKDAATQSASDAASAKDDAAGAKSSADAARADADAAAADAAKIDAAIDTQDSAMDQVVTDTSSATRTTLDALYAAPLDWVDVTLASGHAFRSGFPVQVAKDARGLVYLRGEMDADGFNTDASQVFATIPDGYVPSQESRWIGWSTGATSTPFGGWISGSSGDMVLYRDGAAASSRQFPSSHFCIIVQPWEAKA